WAHGWQTKDVRRIPYGPLPRDWARWRGIHVHGKEVVLSYDVGTAHVLDHPRVIGDDADALFVRNLRVGASAGTRWHRVAAVEAPRIEGAIVSGARAVFGVQVQGSRASWRHRDGALFLELAASAEPVLVRILIAPMSERGQTRLREWLESERACFDPSPLTKPGPPRWPTEVTTVIAPHEPDRSGPSLAFVASDQPQRVRVEKRPGSIANVETWEGGVTVATLIESEASARARQSDPSIEHRAWAHWEFEEGQGSVATDRLTGRILEVAGTAWRRGRAGRSLEFEGATVARVVDGGALGFDDEVTISAWVSTDRDGTLLSRMRVDGPWVAGGKTFFIREGKLAFDIGWVGVVVGRTPIADGTWHHVALSYDGKNGTVRLYVDGVLDGSGTLEPGEAVEEAVLQLGFTAPNFPGDPWLHAKLDELWIHRRVLSEAEVGLLRDRAVPRRSVGYRVERAPAGSRWIANADELLLEIPATDREGTVALLRADDVLDRSAALATFRAATESERSAVAIDRLSWPDDNPWQSWMRFGGFDFFDDGDRAAISTWSGDVWIVRGLLGGDELAWQRIASGLNQPLGLEIVDDEIYVLGRDQITRLVDHNEDGETDFYECFHAGVRNSAHFHEFALDLQLGLDGRFYYLKGARHAKPALFPEHGTLVAVSRDGSEHELIAAGLRGPNGLAIGTDGAFYTTDQEGHWMPANLINRMVRGGFYGNGWSYLPSGVPETFDPPICWVHPSVDRSPSAPAFVASDRWIVPRGTLLCLSYGTGEIFRVAMAAKPDGTPRAGAIRPLPIELPTGIHRARFHPVDGQLYVCGLF
ncbi:MAG: LamG-like jellyroll fold domain-containing protein, partial [Planctomycetota bacterium]